MSTTPTQTVTVAAKNSTVAQKIVDSHLQIAQRACANFVLDYLLDNADVDPMVEVSVSDILEGAKIFVTKTQGSPSDSANSKGQIYYDGKRKGSKRVKNMTLQCRQISPRRKRNASKH